jgi:hypothetical protein
MDVKKEYFEQGLVWNLEDFVSLKLLESFRIWKIY